MKEKEMLFYEGARSAGPNKIFTTIVREEMTDEQRAQADKLNAALLSLNKLTGELIDVRERLEIANVIFRREERIWKDMLRAKFAGPIDSINELANIDASTPGPDKGPADE
jgi:hypothetical protein